MFLQCNYDAQFQEVDSIHSTHLNQNGILSRLAHVYRLMQTKWSADKIEEYTKCTHTLPRCEAGEGAEESNRKRCSAFIFIGIFIWLAFAITATHPKRTNIGNMRDDSMILFHCINTFTHTLHTRISIPTYLHIFMDFSCNAAILSHFIATVNCFSQIHTCIGHTFVDEKFIDIFRYWLFCLLLYSSFVCSRAWFRYVCELCKSSTVSIIFYSFRTRTHFQSKNLIIYKFADVITFFSFRLAAREMQNALVPTIIGWLEMAVSGRLLEYWKC